MTLDDGAADGQDAGDRVQIADPQFGQLTPAQPAFDIGLDQQLSVRVGQGLVEKLELVGSNDSRGLLLRPAGF